ncbi:TATA-binding protein-associated factor BTAF1 [Camellia lanceoleosa]|uniref:TATA-binding protein-associated factor BTAF1 n=1 Tax=Camellia lanceoleosa TaxID=1840588 RepID=A0ACC0FKD5_9ERIC|nr:TATA-binding protein-associated factor BTAF1 [Camellia lanceoleosa]
MTIKYKRTGNYSIWFTLDATKCFWPVALPRKSHFKAAAKMRALKLESDSCVSVASDYAKSYCFTGENGDPPTNPIKIIVGADVEMSASHTRVVTATALGTFISKLLEGCMQYVVYPLWKALTSLSGVQREVASMVLISWFKESFLQSLIRLYCLLMASIKREQEEILQNKAAEALMELISHCIARSLVLMTS